MVKINVITRNSHTRARMQARAQAHTHISTNSVFSGRHVTDWKFLGVIIDQYLSFNSHVAFVVQKAQKRYFSLLRLKRMSVATEKLSMFYIAHIRSILTYSMPAIFPLF